jgi:hypothetical protein
MVKHVGKMTDEEKSKIQTQAHATRVGLDAV